MSHKSSADATEVMEALAILDACAPEGDPAEALVLADYFLERGQERLAATALDRAWGLDPGDPFVTRQRQELFDRLAVTEHGIRFRYVPAGSFLMGSDTGDPDERPVHPVKLGDYWLSETPITWAAYCHLMGWRPPPAGVPAGQGRSTFSLHQENKIRLQYCETHTRGARDWHAHAPDETWTSGDGTISTSAELFGPIDRSDPARPFEYDVKPMVAVSWQSAEELCRALSSADARVAYSLPTEAQWEKAARGGRIGAPYPWGQEPADPRRCDVGRFGEFSMRPPQLYPGNGYGLLGMSGGVWEWTADVYDALAYHQRARQRGRHRAQAGEARAPEPPPAGEDVARALRGGSWADCAGAATVSFRMSRTASSWRDERGRAMHEAPNIGFRLCRTAIEP